MSKENKLSDDKISTALRNPEMIVKAIQKRINEALLRHKQAGNPICEWRDGKVVWIPAEEISINTKPK